MSGGGARATDGGGARIGGGIDALRGGNAAMGGGGNWSICEINRLMMIYTLLIVLSMINVTFFSDAEPAIGGSGGGGLLNESKSLYKSTFK